MFQNLNDFMYILGTTGYFNFKLQHNTKRPGPVRGGGGPGETIFFWPLFKYTVMTKKKSSPVCSRGIYLQDRRNGEFRKFRNRKCKKTK